MTQENDTTTERKLWFQGLGGGAYQQAFAEVINDALLATIILTESNRQNIMPRNTMSDETKH